MNAARTWYEELNDLYQKILNRKIDYSGYFTYATLLERGECTLEDIAKILQRSDEYRQKQEKKPAAN